MESIFTILFTSLFVIGHQNANQKDESRIKTFDLKVLPKISNVKLSDLGFTEVEYIPLETNEKSVFNRITDLKVGNGFFLVQYYTTLLKFNSNGSFIAKIGTEGRGPNEFTVVHDLDIDKKNQKIYLVSAWQRKINVYSENGKFIRTFRCPLNTTHIKVTEDGILCYSINSFANTETSFNLIDTAGRIIKSFPNKYPWQLTRRDAYVVEAENLFYRFNNQLFKKELYSDTIYVYAMRNFKPYLVIEQWKRLITAKARSDFGPEYLMENFITPWKLFEFGDYIYYEFLINHKGYGLIGSKNNDFHVIINTEEGLYNDLDGGPNVGPNTIKDDNTIISWIDAIKLKNYVASDAFKNSTPKYPEKEKALIKLADSLKETDNPVLMLVRLKK
jgi:hypothetical protein